MRIISTKKIIQEIKKLCIESNCIIRSDLYKSLASALEEETSNLGKETLKILLENSRIARREMIPLCQDTGIACVFIQIGQDVRITGGNLCDAINRGISQGYRDGYLRKSVVKDPLRRFNTNDNTPAVIYTEIVPGKNLKIWLIPKGAGAENMSRIKIFNPTASFDDIENFVVETVKIAGENACPPLVIGVGIGGTFDYACFLAKKALLRKIGERNKDPYYAKLEKRLLTKVNKTGIGPLGFGGRITALDVFIEFYPCHIGSLPVAVNLNCHSFRTKFAKL